MLSLALTTGFFMRLCICGQMPYSSTSLGTTFGPAGLGMQGWYYLKH